MARIIINRTGEYINRLRNYQVYIDGKKAGTIANGQIKEFNVSAGKHVVFLMIDWASSPSLQVHLDEDESKSLKAGGFTHAKWLMPVAITIIILSFIINLIFDFDYLFYLVIPVSLVMLYYMTFGRKKYLSLSEIKSK